jgi:hypothetical protein
LQLVKKFPAFHGTRRFITALTSVRHLSLSWASPIQSIYPHPTYWRSFLILSTHLRLGLPSGNCNKMTLIHPSAVDGNFLIVRSIPRAEEPPHPGHAITSLSFKPILILSSHLRLGLASGTFPLGFPTKPLQSLVFTITPLQSYAY